MPRRRARRSRFGLAVLVLVMLLGTGELLTRMLMPDLEARPYKDALLGWASKEYLSFETTPVSATDERLRLLALGDSFLDLRHYQRNDEDTRFPAALESKIPDQLVTRTLATSGWGTDQELLAYLAKGRPWKPDVVVLGFCSNNDLLNILATSHGRESTKPYFRIEDNGELALYDEFGAPLELRILQTAAGEQGPRSALLDYLKLLSLSFGSAPHEQLAGVDPRYALYDGIEDPSVRLIERLPGQLEIAPQNRVSTLAAYVADPGELIQYQWALLERLVERLRDEVRADGAQLVFMLLPTSFKARDIRFLPGGSMEHEVSTPEGRFLFRSAEAAERTQALCERLGVAYFNPCQEFGARVAEREAYETIWPDPLNRHYSPAGQQLLSVLLGDYLRDELGLLSD